VDDSPSATLLFPAVPNRTTNKSHALVKAGIY
jgi:hypothetical protein